MPSLLKQTFDIHSAWLNGISFSIMTLSGALGILLLRKYTSIFILKLGTISLIVGNISLLFAIHWTNIVVLFLAALIAGFGFGTSFMGAIRFVAPLALPDERAALMSAFYIESYLAFSIPAILIGLIIQKIGLEMSSNLYIMSIIFLGFVELFFISKQPK
ncbi:hypothetical protein BFG52_10800 [Acinetobacter larvae]|uniref:Major facilitator superfamily (MFS) profile domain-containing protein n=2 Tax=Acinetobacter larvae TaxID=1789224 RepID=A0A1B2M0T2_9GAMM|nr:hypothetical protein BFG52_10800 [Acinetobacter larvae]